MSCPDWFSLVACQEEEPERWQSALEHHKSCDRCRQEALDAEPTLLFQQMPVPELGRQDLADIKRAVATMRRALPLAESSEMVAPLPQRLVSRSRRVLRSPKNWRLAAAVAAALVAVLAGATWFENHLFLGLSDQDATASNVTSLNGTSLPTPASPMTDLDPAAWAGGGRAFESSTPTFWPEDLLSGQDQDLEELPLVEDSDPSYGSIVEVVGQDISFVLVLPSLDV